MQGLSARAQEPVVSGAMTRRRLWLAFLALAACQPAALPGSTTASGAPAQAAEPELASGASGAPEAAGWNAVPGILARIVPPTFAARECAITAYGAVAGGQAD